MLEDMLNCCITDNVHVTSVWTYKIKNGAKLTIGDNFKTELKADQHFNWFQKLMWKWCFGIKVEDYSDD